MKSDARHKVVKILERVHTNIENGVEEFGVYGKIDKHALEKGSFLSCFKYFFTVGEQLHEGMYDISIG